MGFLREVNEEKTELQNTLAEREHFLLEDRLLERCKHVALQQRVDADEVDRLADREAAHEQVKTPTKNSKKLLQLPLRDCSFGEFLEQDEEREARAK